MGGARGGRRWRRRCTSAAAAAPPPGARQPERRQAAARARPGLRHRRACRPPAVIPCGPGTLARRLLFHPLFHRFPAAGLLGGKQGVEDLLVCERILGRGRDRAAGSHGI